MSEEKAAPDVFLDVAAYVGLELEGYAKELDKNGCLIPTQEALVYLASNPEIGIPLLLYWKLDEFLRVMLDVRKEISELRKHVGAPEPPDYP